MPLNAAEEVEYAALARQKPMNAVIDRGDSAVQQFYKDSVIFLTGSSGFFGKQLIEKLFRACQIKKIYILLRSKKGLKIQERMELLLKDPVFDKVREKQPNFADKIVPVAGDVAEIRLGIGEKDWIELTEEVDTIFHVAATVRFDEPLSSATLTNIRGTREVLILAKSCSKLKNLIHVSTAFCHATVEKEGKEVLEQFYTSPVPPHVMIEMAEQMDEDRLKAITPELISGWPNTYTFTKAIAEELVRSHASELPISTCVVRPPAVICTYNEPAPGWIDLSCIYGPSGFILGVGLGMVRTAWITNKRINFAPLDIVNNVIITAPWDTAQRRLKGNPEIPVYNVANERSMITFSFIGEVMRNDCRKFSSPKAMWYCYLVEIKTYKIFYNIVALFLHYIPAYLLDGICAVFNIKIEGVQSFVKIYEKYDKLVAVNRYFMSHEFAFKDYNVKALIKNLSDVDNNIFNCDLSTVDYKELVKVWCLGIRKYATKEGFKGVEEGCRKQKYLKVANYAVIALYVYLIYIIFCISFTIVKYMFGM